MKVMLARVRNSAGQRGLRLTQRSAVGSELPVQTSSLGPLFRVAQNKVSLPASIGIFEETESVMFGDAKDDFRGHGAEHPLFEERHIFEKRMPQPLPVIGEQPTHRCAVAETLDDLR